MFVLIYCVSIYFYVNVEANRINERYPYQTPTAQDHEPRGSWANAAAYTPSGSAVSSSSSSGGSAVSSAVSSSGLAVTSKGSVGKPMNKPAFLPTAPVARFPSRSRVQSGVRPLEPGTRRCGPPNAPVARYPYGSGVRSARSRVRPAGSGFRPAASAFSSTSATGGAQAFASYYPMEFRRDCHESTWTNTDGGHYHCNGDRNATFKTCPNPCPPTCRNPQSGNPCYALCIPHGCECNPGYVLSDEGRCILNRDCPDVLCNGDRNATYKQCPDPCPSTCALLGITRVCDKTCLPYGCECNKGYHINDEGKCVRIQDCPGALCNGDRNATFKECPNPCPRTCELPSGPEACIALCPARGCECNEGYFLNDKGKCVQLQDCPAEFCNGDRNATFKECPNQCPGTCELPGGPETCTAVCSGRGCECNQGYFLNEKGKCVLLQDCPGAKSCSTNETFVYCKGGCPTDNCPVDDSRSIIACDPPFPCPSGCVCKGDYLKLSHEDDTCILATECPPFDCTRPNEVWSNCAPACLYERCSDIGEENSCDRTYHYCRPNCICKPGYYRDDSDICVPKANCPLKCSSNETEVECKTTCPPQSCEISYTEYLCPNESKCERGCDCRTNYLRNASGACILNDECPPPLTCGEFEVPSSCRIECPPQTCDSIFTTYNCQNQTCEVGCNCIDGYLRNKLGVCIPSEKCFLETECDISEECRPTCSNPTPKNCPSVVVPKENIDGCKCKEGYILSDANGGCIEIGNCPEGCNGDFNATVTACPWPCPSTCDSPNASSCGQKCKAVGCQCKPGFILSEDKGKCILPDDCECGNPCGINGTYSECSFRCPNQNCPEDDSRSVFACKPGRPCPPGCMCREYYRRTSSEDDTCILAQDCPVITCTRPNEIFDSCASECLAENCVDLQTINTCVPDPKNCQPKCVCIEGYYRDEIGDCVPKDQCSNQCDVPQNCRPTCAVPIPPDCDYIEPSDTNNECNCQSGYILDACGGTCIKIEDCPKNQTCNGDPNASIKECPQPCPSTCLSPNATPCKRKCIPIGCECNPGYLLSSDGVCILPDQCKGGNPCGPNATFVPCRYECSTNYCPTDDSRAAVVCETSPFAPCYSGCACRLNHKRLSVEDPRCILSTECRPVDCTRPNEEWDPCPSDCLSEYCEDVDKTPVVCNTLLLNCNPKCVCNKTFFRNSSDICVSTPECLKLNEEKKKSE